MSNSIQRDNWPFNGADDNAFNRDDFGDESNLIPDSGPSHTLKAPWGNFFDDFMLVLIYHSQRAMPEPFDQLRDHLQTVVNTALPDMIRADAAVNISKYVQSKTREINFFGQDTALSWLALSAEQFPSPAGLVALTTYVLARRGLKIVSDGNHLIPILETGANVKSLEFSVDVPLRWLRAIEMCLQAPPEVIASWDMSQKKAAIECFVHYFTFAPSHSATKPQVLTEIVWANPLWDQLIDQYGADQSPHTVDAEQVVRYRLQKTAVLARLHSNVDLQVPHRSAPASSSKDRSSPSLSRPMGAAVAPSQTGGQVLSGEVADDANEKGGDPVGHTVLIRGEIPPTSDREDQSALNRYSALQAPVPFAVLPPLAEIQRIRQALKDEFPWATKAVDVLVEDLLARRYHGGMVLGMSPVLLVGPPGTGKTRLAQRFSDELKIPNTVINMAGMSDIKTLKGVTRGWSGARPSRILEIMMQCRTPSPLIILDEVDKAGAAYSNGGNPHDALLDLLEPGNAKRYSDVFLVTECDLSNVLYVLTANSINRLPSHLLSRLKPVFVPEPSPEHSNVIIDGVLTDLTLAWGLPPGTLELNYQQRQKLVGMAPRQIRQMVPSLLTTDEPPQNMH